MKFIFTVIAVLVTSVSYAQSDKKDIFYADYTSFLTYLSDSIQKIGKDIDRLIFIRREVAKTIKIGAGGKDISTIHEHWTELSPKEFYDIFKNNEGTTKCGGTSEYLKGVYENLGYTAETFDMGCPDVYTHVVTIVKNKDDNKYYLQDAFHNVSYSLTKDKIYPDFATIIKLLKSKKARKIKVKYDTKAFDFDTTGLYQQLQKRGMEKKYKLALIFSNINRKKFVKRSQKIALRKDNCLNNNELPKNPLYLMLLPLEYNSPLIKTFYEN
ncbi:MAG TPA: hypothetical protein PLP27_00730 [Crocinitomicaceae bacterium]|nr:hypothetical protein [Crocinitomicaceae bacterium]